jgi:DNA-binding NarL/FixJ family response regulator
MESAPALTVMLVASNGLAQDGMRKVLERGGFVCSGQAADLIEGVSLAAAIKPQVAVLDVPLRKVEEIETSRRLRNASPDTHTIILAPYPSNDAPLSALLAGASAILVKEVRGARHLAEAIKRVSDGDTVFPASLSDHISEFVSGDASPLDTQERRLLRLIAEQKTDAEIASITGINGAAGTAIHALITRLLQASRRR